MPLLVCSTTWHGRTTVDCRLFLVTCIHQHVCMSILGCFVCACTNAKHFDVRRVRPAHLCLPAGTQPFFLPSRVPGGIAACPSITKHSSYSLRDIGARQHPPNLTRNSAWFAPQVAVTSHRRIKSATEGPAATTLPAHRRWRAHNRCTSSGVSAIGGGRSGTRIGH